MTTPATTSQPSPSPAGERGGARNWRAWLSSTIQLILAVAITCGALVLLWWFPLKPQSPSTGTDAATNAEAVRLVGPRLVAVKADTALEKKLAVAVVESERISTPVLKVTGSIVARLPAGKGSSEGRWDFNAPELATAYADWLKARAEVPFNEKQLTTIRELTAARVGAQTKVVERLEKLVKAGTDPEKDLVTAKADLLQAKLQGQKDEHEAETALKNSVRTRTTLERQLFQAGIDPELLLKDADGMAIVVAEVPEARIGLVQAKQSCEARFFAFPNEKFSGRVGSLAPTLSKERRTLRVFFEVDDPQSRLKPGMFAEIGLGTDPRQTLLVPADGVVHVGRADYVFVAAEPGQWKVTEIKAGEQHGQRVEVLDGLKPGDRVIGAGAILLKPIAVQAVHEGSKAETTRNVAIGGSGQP